MTTSLPSLSVRIDIDDESRIGPGKILLLEKIDEFGSISAAGRAMEMSYKRAWDLVDEINRMCRQPAVQRQTGGKNGGGAALTPSASRWLRAIARSSAMRQVPSGKNWWRCAATSASRRRPQTAE